MSHADLFQLLWNWNVVASAPAHVFTVPVTIRFTVQDRLWRLDGETFIHSVAEGAADIPVETGELDAWETRARFFRLDTLEEFLTFLNRTGTLAWPSESGFWTVQKLRLLQVELRRLLQTPPQKWRAQENADVFQALVTARTVRLQFGWRNNQHCAVIIANSTLQALIASVQLDHLRNARYSFCARADCRTQYEITSKHKRKYCSPECAHMEVVRRARANMKPRKPVRN